MQDTTTIESIANSILRDALAAIPDSAKRLTDEDRDVLRLAATLLARATVDSLRGQAPSEADQVHLRAIRVNLQATGQQLAANALNDAVTAALNRALTLLRVL